jgi:hypothetical protein
MFDWIIKKIGKLAWIVLISVGIFYIGWIILPFVFGAGVVLVVVYVLYKGLQG